MFDAWLIIGDFNVYLLVEEKIGGACASLSKCRELRDFINSSRLHNMGFVGPKFT